MQSWGDAPHLLLRSLDPCLLPEALHCLGALLCLAGPSVACFCFDAAHRDERSVCFANGVPAQPADAYRAAANLTVGYGRVLLLSWQQRVVVSAVQMRGACACFSFAEQQLPFGFSAEAVSEDVSRPSFASACYVPRRSGWCVLCSSMFHVVAQLQPFIGTALGLDVWLAPLSCIGLLDADRLIRIVCYGSLTMLCCAGRFPCFPAGCKLTASHWVVLLPFLIVSRLCLLQAKYLASIVLSGSSCCCKNLLTMLSVCIF